MRTPTGQECPYFYGDYYRGKNVEECRLIGNKAAPLNWKSNLCETCPVPGIIRANSCPNLVLEATIQRGFLWIKPKVKVYAACTQTLALVKKPEIGCGQCHPLPPVFTDKKS